MISPARDPDDWARGPPVPVRDLRRAAGEGASQLSIGEEIDLHPDDDGSQVWPEDPDP